MIDFFNKYGGALFLYILGIIFALLLVYQIATGQQPNNYAIFYIGLAVVQATHSSGVEQGVKNTNDTVNKTALAQFPLTPAGIIAKVTSDELTANNKTA